MTALEELCKPAASLSNPHVEHWREKGGKVLGYFCTYVPVEIIHAAGMLPYRMRATGSTSSYLGDAYTYHTMCSFCRHSLDQAMRGEYKFLDGLVAFYSCDHVRRSFDVWSHGKIEHLNSPFYLHFLSVPVKADALALEWLAGGFEGFRRSLQDHFCVSITNEALCKSIKVYNEKRRLLRSLYELRKQEAPKITGTEILEVLIASEAIPVEEFNQMMGQLLGELREREGFSNYTARLLLSGGELEDPAYVKLIEDLGGMVVADFLCFGIRSFWDLVDEDSDPITALANGYLGRISCPRMIDHPRRREFVGDLVKEFKADGIIVQLMKYCDSWGGESAMTEWEMKKEDIPCMVLEREYLLGAGGQMRTRVQAFLEIVGSR